MTYPSAKTGLPLIPILLAAAIALSAQSLSAQDVQTSSTDGQSYSESTAMRSTTGSYSGDKPDANMRIEELLADSREAGLLTDWHLCGRFGRGEKDLEREFAPEKEAVKAALRPHQMQHYEMVFPEGRFALPPALASHKGVFYASSSTYLSDSGEWNVYLESSAEAIVFVDGRRVVESRPNAPGVLRATIHAESGYHSVLVKFTAQAAPFRVAILPPNSGSRRKNNTPYLQASPPSEDMMAMQMGEPDGAPISAAVSRCGSFEKAPLVAESMHLLIRVDAAALDFFRELLA